MASIKFYNKITDQWELVAAAGQGGNGQSGFTIEAKDMSDGAELIMDESCWKGYCRSYTQPSSDAKETILGEFIIDKLRYFSYSLNCRIRTNKKDDKNIIKILIDKLNGEDWTNISTININGKTFPKIDEFTTIATSFKHEKCDNNKLRFQIIALGINDLKIDLECAIINQAQGAIFTINN